MDRTGLSAVVEYTLCTRKTGETTSDIWGGLYSDALSLQHKVSVDVLQGV